MNEQQIWERAQFAAFDRVLQTINTIDATGEKFRSELYAKVMEMRPTKYEACKSDDEVVK